MTCSAGGSIDLTQKPLLDNVWYLVAILVPVAALTFYTAAKSQRLSEFLETVSDSRLPFRHKLRAFLRVWRRR